LYRSLVGLCEYDAWRYQGEGDSEDAALYCELLNQNLSDAVFEAWASFLSQPMAGKYPAKGRDQTISGRKKSNRSGDFV
jgi:hypothetical protein